VECALPQCEDCTVVAQRFSERAGIGELTLAAPLCAAGVRPGQFVHLRLPGLEAHILRRPFSVYRACASAGTITLLYQVVGAATRHMRSLSVGAELSILGPVGSGWEPGRAQRCLLLGGGVGAAPLFLLAEELVARGVALCLVLGAATRELLVCEDAFAGLVGSARCHLTTDDGSRGFKGRTTERAAALLADEPYDYIAACGPEPMLRKVAALAAAADIRCELSLERRMACGLGACLGCVVETTRSNQRACVDGPVFNARELCW
jgi:dihydroorotate dehydrogenase electron transfer subunit